MACALLNSFICQWSWGRKIIPLWSPEKNTPVPPKRNPSSPFPSEAWAGSSDAAQEENPSGQVHCGCFCALRVGFIAPTEVWFKLRGNGSWGISGPESPGFLEQILHNRDPWAAWRRFGNLNLAPVSERRWCSKSGSQIAMYHTAHGENIYGVINVSRACLCSVHNWQ